MLQRKATVLLNEPLIFQFMVFWHGRGDCIVRRTRGLGFKIESQMWNVGGGAYHMRTTLSEIDGAAVRSGTCASASEYH